MSAQPAARKAAAPRKASRAGKGRYFQRANAITSLILTLPVFIAYEVGLLFSDKANGVDFITRTLIKTLRLNRERFLWLNLGMLAVLGIAILILRRKNRFDPVLFFPIVLESAVYAATMGSAIVFVMQHLLPGGRWHLAAGSLAGMSLLDKTVISLGAGFNEELVFRLILFGGLAWLFTFLFVGRAQGIAGDGKTPRGTAGRRFLALLMAYLISSILFSLAHHVGPAGEPIKMSVLTYRFLAGMIFALLYHVRGFATAVYTHTLYDFFVLALRA